MSTEIIERQNGVPSLSSMTASLSEMEAQVQLIQHLMRSVMKESRDGKELGHYGPIPGCGEKKVLYKPGADKLSLFFRLAPAYRVERTDLPNGHREYHIVCVLTHIPTQTIFGEGVGSCSTMERKYRYRSETTDRLVPKEYWQERDKKLLGGEQYSVKKVDNKWWISEQIEHTDPADYFNTCLKMAKKRAHVDAILTVTAASDIFTQDIDEDFIDPNATTPDEMDLVEEAWKKEEREGRERYLKEHAEKLAKGIYIIEFGSKRGTPLSAATNTPWLENHLKKHDAELSPAAKAAINKRIDEIEREWAQKQDAQRHDAMNTAGTYPTVQGEVEGEMVDGCTLSPEELAEIRENDARMNRES